MKEIKTLCCYKEKYFNITLGLQSHKLCLKIYRRKGLVENNHKDKEKSSIDWCPTTH